MEYFSSRGKSSEKFWNILKGIVRIIIRVVIEVFHRLVINMFDTIFGFLSWPEKKLRIKILILAVSKEPAVFLPSELDLALGFAGESVKKNFNVKLLPHKNGHFVEVLKATPPVEALYTKGGNGALKEEFKEAGNFFASNLCGLFYPVTTFVVIDIAGASGCSLGPLTDYITLDRDGAKNDSTLVHEIVHACGLWHVKERSNLLYRFKSRGNDVNWWQKNIFRSSRHITYW